MLLTLLMSFIHLFIYLFIRKGPREEKLFRVLVIKPGPTELNIIQSIFTIIQ